MRVSKLALAIEDHLQSCKELAPCAPTVHSMWKPDEQLEVTLPGQVQVDHYVYAIEIDGKLTYLTWSVLLIAGEFIRHIETDGYSHELKLAVDDVAGTVKGTLRSFEHSTGEQVYFNAQLLTGKRVTHLTKRKGKHQ